MVAIRLNGAVQIRVLETGRVSTTTMKTHLKLLVERTTMTQETMEVKSWPSLK